MANRKQVVASILQRVGVRPVAQTFDQRLCIQKAIYLVQEALSLRSFTLDYQFTWYAHGPYSPALTRDYYAMDEADRTAVVQLKDEAAATLLSIQPLMTPPPASELEQHKWLELAASWHYHLKSRSDRTPNQTNIDSFKREKPEFTDSQIMLADQALRKVELL